MKRRRNTNFTKNPEKFFRDPLTYVAFGIQASPLALRWLGIDENVHDANSITYAVTSSFVGSAVLAHSFIRNLGFDYPGKMMDALYSLALHARIKKRVRKFSNDLSSGFDRLDSIGLKELEPLVIRGRGQLSKGRVRSAYRTLKEAYSLIDRIGGSRTPETMQELAIREPVQEDERYLIVPRKSYNKLSENQKLRVQYFIADMTHCDNNGQYEGLYRDIHNSEWYKRRLTDMQTYTFFDDITLGITRGTVPNRDDIERYIRCVIGQ